MNEQEKKIAAKLGDSEIFPSMYYRDTGEKFRECGYCHKPLDGHVMARGTYVCGKSGDHFDWNCIEYKPVKLPYPTAYQSEKLLSKMGLQTTKDFGFWWLSAQEWRGSEFKPMKIASFDEIPKGERGLANNAGLALCCEQQHELEENSEEIWNALKRAIEEV